MSSNFVKLIVATALIGAISAAPASADGWRHGSGYFWGPAAAAGLVSGLVIGGALASQPAYPAGYGAYGPVGPTCYFTRQPVVDGWGQLIGHRQVRVCE